MSQQIIVFGVIIVTLFLFIYGRIRYEFVSILGVLILAITGIISPEETFSGFSHPAVITVASVLVISEALLKSGIIEHLVVLFDAKTDNIYLKLMGLMVVTAFLSSYEQYRCISIDTTCCT